MIPFAEALETVLAHAEPLGVERVRLRRLLGRVLAEPVVARAALPRFDNSAVDGFGVRVADVAHASPAAPARLRLQATTPAGAPAAPALARGAARKILTGAPISPGVEAVVMREHCEERPGWVLVRRPAHPGENIRRRGEEFRRGDPVLPAGLRLNPAAIGVLATFGCASANVYRQPRLAFLVTGDELARPGQRLRPGQIYDANTHTLAAAAAALGLTPCLQERVSDDRDATTEALARALEAAEVVIVVGGVSMGDHDYVKEACAALGVEARFWQVAMKPGKPNYFGTFTPPGAARRLVFGLPGNPVAALLSFNRLVRPALLKLMGAHDLALPPVTAVLGEDLHKEAGRLEFVRAVAAVEHGTLVVRPTTGQGSHMLGGMAVANCVIPFAAPLETLRRGEPVAIEFLE